MPTHRAAQLTGKSLEQLHRKGNVVGQAALQRRQVVMVPAAELGNFLTQAPARVGRHLVPQDPDMLWIDWTKGTNLGALQRLADRFEKRPGIVLDQGFEEGQADHRALTFVNTRRQKVVDIVSENMAVEE